VIHALGHRVTAASTRNEFSPNWAAFRLRAPGARFAGDPAELLEDESLDAVVVCLPWQVADVWSKRLLACPKPLLIEKPLGLAADRLRASLRRYPDVRNKLVGYNRRYYRTVACVRDRLAQGGLKAVQATISEDVERHVARHGPEVVPHLLAFSSSHFLDLLLHLVGALRVVRLSAHAEGGPAAPFVSFNGLLETSTGIPVSLALNAGDPSPAGLRFLFDDHTTWILQPLERLRVYDRYVVSDDRPESTIRSYTPHEALALDEPADYKPGFLAQMRSFLGEDFGPGARPQDGLNVLNLIDEIRAAA
jgi:predicted dehydrogenase